jgi:GNAT superfamily N-acetyltransferase
MSVCVRSATPADASPIALVQVESWQAAYRGLIPDDVIDARTVEVRTNQWAAFLSDSHSIALVACDEGGIVQGFTSALLLDGSDGGFQSYLQTLYVRPGAWRQGIGRELLRCVCTKLHAAGVKNMALRTLRLSSARAFYERLGARLVHEGIAHDAGRFDDVVYAFDDISTTAEIRAKL